MPQYKIKLITGVTFAVEAEVTDTVATLKEKIEGAHKDAQKDLQRLIHAGKILADSATLDTYKINDSDYIICTLSTKKAAPAEPPAAEVAATPATPAVPAAAAAEVSAVLTAESTVVDGPEAEGVVANIVDMGFPREEVVRALRAAFGNPDRAVEFLSSNTIPAEEPTPVPAAPPAAATDAPPAAGPSVAAFPALGGAPANAAGAGGAGPLAELENHPQMAQLRQVVQQNPRMLPSILSMLAQQNPQLVNAILQNQEEFARILELPPGTAVAEDWDGEEGDEDEGMGVGAEHQGVISLTEAEGESVQRLQELGFGRQRAVEAYLACDKNEELAANFLFENMGD